MSNEQQGDDRHIAIGTSVTDSAVVSGDGNTVTVTKIIQISVDQIKTHELITTSPYKGLKKFEPEDVDRFFGRDQFLIELVNELEQTNLILLLGASGSGKSSVVRAGLIPQLRQEWGTRFVNLMFTPDYDPFESLYGSLLSRHKQSEAQMARTGQADTLSQVVKTLKQPDTFWLIFIDQFEELFTISDPEKRDRFIAGLVNLSQERASDRLIKIVATMRADFLDRFDPYPANLLARATQSHRPLITQMQPNQLRLAIEQPAAQHGVVFETGLVKEIIEEVWGQAGYLPLLQYTLDLLWETAVQDGDIHDRTLNISSYRRLGGVSGALKQRVEQIYQALSPAEQLAAQRIFLKLVEIGGNEASGTEWKSVRRRANRAEFQDQQEQMVLTQLINQNLLVSDAVVQAAGAAPEFTVEIAHEILLTSWTTLNEWIRQNRQAIALRNRLNDDVKQWQATKLDDELWSGAKLERVVELRNDPVFDQILGGFSPEATRFIEASVNLHEAQRQRELKTAQRLAQEEAKARRAAQNRTRAVFIASVVILGFAILAGYQWRQAEIGQISALTQSSEAQFSLNRNSFDALLEALGAASRLKSLPGGGAGSELRHEVTTTLGQAVNWVMEKNRLEGHKGNVQDVSFSPDGQTIVTAGYDNTVKFWRPSGELICTANGHTDGVMSVSFSPDGKRVASAGEDQTVKLWNQDCQLLRTIKAHNAAVYSVSFSPDGQTLVSGSKDKTVKLWSLNGKLLRTMSGHADAIWTVEFSPDGETVASASWDHTARLWDTQTGQLRQTLEQNALVWGLSFSPDGQTIVTGDVRGTVNLWNHRGELQQTLKGHTGIVKGIGFSPDGQTIATASDDGTVKLWRSRDGALIETLSGHTTTVNNATFSPDGSILASASHDKTVKLWKLERQVSVFHTGHNGVVYKANFSPDGQMILTASDDKTAKLFTHSGTLLKTFTEHNDAITDANMSPDGQTIATSSADNTVKLLTRQGTLLKTLTGHNDDIWSVSFSPDGRMLATASKDKTVRLWNLQGRTEKTLREHQDWVYSVNFSPNSQLLVTASEDHTARLWKRDGTLLKTLQHGDSAVYNAVFRPPDGQMIATVSQDNTTKLWDLKGQMLCTLKEHTDGIWGVNFSPDGQTLATGSDDKTIKLWNVGDCSWITTLVGHRTDISSVSFSPNGKILVSAGTKGRDVILWDVNALDLESLLFKGCAQVSDYLKANTDAPKYLCNTSANNY